MVEKIESVENLCNDLGNAYEVRCLEGDYIICRYFNPEYFVEIEFRGNPATKFSCIIRVYYVVEDAPYLDGEVLKNVGSISDIFSVEDLKKHLTALEEKYTP